MCVYVSQQSNRQVVGKKYSEEEGARAVSCLLLSLPYRSNVHRKEGFAYPPFVLVVFFYFAIFCGRIILYSILY